MMKSKGLLLLLCMLLVTSSMSHGLAPARSLQAAAHSRLQGMDDLRSLSEQKAIYQSLYAQMADRTSDPNLRARIFADRDRILSQYDQRIEQLSSKTPVKRSRFLPGVGRFFRNIGRRINRGARWTADRLGEGIKQVANTTIKALPTRPEELLEHLVMHLTTGGGSSFADFLKNQVKNSAKRSAQQYALTEIAKVARENPDLARVIDLNELTGNRLKLSDDFRQAYGKQVASGREGGDSADPSDTADSAAGYEGEGGYDKADEADQAPPTNDEAATADEPAGYEGEGGYDDVDETEDNPDTDKVVVADGPVDTEESPDPQVAAEPIDPSGVYSCTFRLDSYEAVVYDHYEDTLMFSGENRRKNAQVLADRANASWGERVGVDTVDRSNFQVRLREDGGYDVFVSDFLGVSVGRHDYRGATGSPQSITYTEENDYGTRWKLTVQFAGDQEPLQMKGTLSKRSVNSQYEYIETRTLSFEGEKAN